MKAWLLKPRAPDAPPWLPWFDKCFGLVIGADTAAEARAIAVEHQGDEAHDNSRASPWLDPSLTSCEELQATERGLILRDLWSA